MAYPSTREMSVIELREHLINVHRVTEEDLYILLDDGCFSVLHDHLHKPIVHHHS